jgi:hypothetical protein
MKRFLTPFVAGALMVSGGAAYAASLNVLWYTGGTEASGPGTYETAINNLANPGTGDPVSTTWNITYWTSGAKPSGSFNVLVVASPQGSWSSNPNYTSLNAALPTFGNRELVSGQDADWHFINSPGPTNFNGPRGFLRDAINWAGSGTGLGLVDLGAGNVGSLGLTGLGSATGMETENVVIPPAFAGFPINTGLTTAGLSNWGTSAHETWTGSDPSLWTGINIDGNSSCPGPGCRFVTLVTAKEAGGGVGGVPSPTIGAGLPGLIAAGVGMLAWWRNKRRAQAAA